MGSHTLTNLAFMSCAVIFGGTGFIGVFFAQYFLEKGKADKVYLYDRDPIDRKASAYRRSVTASEPWLVVVEGVLRQPIAWTPSKSVALITNFAAVHREPGHESREYTKPTFVAPRVFVLGRKGGSNQLIFTSSISPYGPSEEV